MYLKWGDYTHPIGEPQISISKQPILTDGGVPIAHVEQWNIQGTLLASGQSAMDAKISAFKAAYAKQNQDLILYLSDGTTESQHTLKRANTRGGVWVTAGPNFPEGRGAEYVTKRTFQVQIQAEVPITYPATALMSFNESLSISGGGPIYGHTETAFGYPVKQQLRANSVFRATQSGSAVGYSFYPSIPYPIFGENNLIEAPKITRDSPRQTGGGFRDYRVSWEYRFESAYILSGLPHARV